MAPSSAGEARIYPAAGRAAEMDEYFAPQHTPSHDLPAAAPLLRNLTVGVLEVLAGVREIEQLARWLTEDAYRSLVTRASLATRARTARGVPAARPAHRILSVRECVPADGVVEAVVIVTGPARTRAIAIRLEGMDRRWRATSLALL
ncbi:Rv3235 family protein [Microbacterium sp. P05]|uniref:Rv3235 family protein n=1 Tax=Microbacterium sp. P05 TaxID=3366948 RepID=UPI00374727AF